MSTYKELQNGSAYTFKNMSTGKMLNLYGGRTANGTNVCQYTADGSDDQKWTFLNDKLYAYGSSTKCLDKFTSSGSAKNNNADIWNNTDDVNQLLNFSSVQASDKFVSIQLKSNGYYLAAYDAVDYPGDRVMNSTANTDAGKTPTSAGNVYWSSTWLGSSCIWVVAAVDAGTSPDPEPEPQPGEGFGNGTIAVGKRPSTLDYSRACYGPTFNRFHKDYANGNGTAQCTWHCYGRAYEVLGKTIEFSGTGGLNGATWYSRITNGEKSNEPKTNSIAVWDEGGNGHVAYVEKVDNEYIYISEANWRGTLNAHDDEDGKVYTLPRTNLTRTASGQRTFTFLGFVHLDI